MLRSIESSFGFLAIQLRRRLPIFASTAACSLLILTSVALGRPQTEALVEDISGTSYLPTVQAELQAATSSIVVAMFEMRVPQDAAAENPSLVLVNELIAAHARGVDVDVILNLRSRFDPESTDPVRDHANGLAAGMLTYKGVDVSYFPQTYHMHSKLVVIDGKTVVVGSHNWTYSALAKNIESSSLIRSPEHAQEKLANIAKLKTVSAAVKLPPDVEQIISVPLGFLLSPDLAPFMTTQNDERAFDAYLLLHRYSDEKEGDAVLSVDMQRLASDLAIDSSKGGSYSRKIATRPLRKLADHYRLIDLEIPRGKNAQVTFLNNALGSAAGVIHLPLAYWTYDLATELKQAEKMAYLICLNEETQALTPPLWMKNQSDLTKKYSISKNPINDGLNGLQRLDLLEITRSPISTSGNYKKRRPNQYRLKPLLSPEERTARWEKLEKKHGTERLAQARALAAILDYDNDFASADQLAKAIKSYGFPTVSNVTTQVATKSATNPNRHPDTVVEYLHNTRGQR